MPREAQLAWGVWRVGKAWGWTERGKWGLKERKFKEPWGHGSGWTPHVCKVVFEDYFLKRNRGWGVLLAFIWATHQHHPTFPGESHLSLLKLARVDWLLHLTFTTLPGLGATGGRTHSSICAPSTQPSAQHGAEAPKHLLLPLQSNLGSYGGWKCESPILATKSLVLTILLTANMLNSCSTPWKRTSHMLTH